MPARKLAHTACSRVGVVRWESEWKLGTASQKKMGDTRETSGNVRVPVPLGYDCGPRQQRCSRAFRAPCRPVGGNASCGTATQHLSADTKRPDQGAKENGDVGRCVPLVAGVGVGPRGRHNMPADRKPLIAGGAERLPGDRLEVPARAGRKRVGGGRQGRRRKSRANTSRHSPSWGRTGRRRRGILDAARPATRSTSGGDTPAEHRRSAAETVELMRTARRARRGGLQVRPQTLQPPRGCRGRRLPLQVKNKHRQYRFPAEAGATRMRPTPEAPPRCTAWPPGHEV